MKKTLLKKLLCSLVVTLMIGTSIPAQAGNVSNPTNNGQSGISGAGAGLVGGKQEVSTAAYNATTFYYTGGAQTWTCPAYGKYKLEVYGAGGGDAYAEDWGTSIVGYSGKGGYATGNIMLNNNDKIRISVGGRGSDSNSGNDRWHSSATGGSGGNTIISLSGSNIIYATGGGGGSFHGWACAGCDKYDHENWSAHCESSNGGNGSGYTGGVLNGSIQSGVCSGHGYAKITPLEIYGKATGGSNQLDITYALNAQQIDESQNTITGHGNVSIKAFNANILNGLTNTTYLNNVIVKDNAVPEKIDLYDENIGNQRIITWETPQSNGTEYEFKAQTYKINFDSQNGTDLIMDTEFN